jgi:aspartate aminotransferase, cytoplasmic
LNNPELFEDWKRDIKTMAHRIIAMREKLYDILTNELKTPGKWDHIVKQIGMFRFVVYLSFHPVQPLTNAGDADSFTGLNTEQSLALTEKAHIYLTNNGRISMAGLNSHNIRYFAANLDKVVRGTL